MSDEPVRIICDLSASVALQLVKRQDDGTGYEQTFRVGPKFVVPGGGMVSEIPGDFWRAWLEQNRTSALVVDGVIREFKPDEDKPAPKG